MQYCTVRLTVFYCVICYSGLLLMHWQCLWSLACLKIKLLAYLRLCVLTWVCHRDPLVELIVVRHSVKLTAQHLSKSWYIIWTGLCVTGPVPLSFTGTVLAPKFWPVEKSSTLWTNKLKKKNQHDVSILGADDIKPVNCKTKNKKQFYSHTVWKLFQMGVRLISYLGLLHSLSADWTPIPQVLEQ